MAEPHRSTSRIELAELNARLVRWLVDAAYPLWAAHGIDAHNGGFIETLAQSGSDLAAPRRARVQPRQIFAFANAPHFGWRGDLTGIVRRGIQFFTEHYRRADGLFRTLVAADGSALDEQALLYDQAFALLGYASAATALGSRDEFERLALGLRTLIDNFLSAGAGARAFRSSADPSGNLESNPHMHLLEACLAWAEIGNDRDWSAWANELAGLALARLLRPDSGAVGEAFSLDWQPAPGLAGRIIEPGHQFEWAWLLLRCNPRTGPLRQAALRLISIGEAMGVHHGVAVNSLLDDLTIDDPNARLWPQTERLKAALLAARVTGDEQYWSMAVAAASSLFPYLRTPIAGLWFDLRIPNGAMLDSPAQASTFYHLVGAIAALDEALAKPMRSGNAED
jgi:mannose/cellobiose epimerase-like protein (N-acyl-D-glucosamine 2-epimerase family)